MELKYIFWLLMILWVFIGPGYGYFVATPNPRVIAGGSILLFAILFVVGWALFGFVVQGGR